MMKRKSRRIDKTEVRSAMRNKFHHDGEENEKLKLVVCFSAG